MKFKIKKDVKKTSKIMIGLKFQRSMNNIVVVKLLLWNLLMEYR